LHIFLLTIILKVVKLRFGLWCPAFNFWSCSTYVTGLCFGLTGLDDGLEDVWATEITILKCS